MSPSVTPSEKASQTPLPLFALPKNHVIATEVSASDALKKMHGYQSGYIGPKIAALANGIVN